MWLEEDILGFSFQRLLYLARQIIIGQIDDVVYVLMNAKVLLLPAQPQTTQPPLSIAFPPNLQCKAMIQR